jgi:hypothetical protein
MTNRSLAALLDLGRSTVGALNLGVAATTTVAEHSVTPLTITKTVLVATPRSTLLLASDFDVFDHILEHGTAALLEIVGKLHLHGADQGHRRVVVCSVSITVLKPNVAHENEQLDLVTTARHNAALLGQVLGVDDLDDGVQLSSVEIKRTMQHRRVSVQRMVHDDHRAETQLRLADVNGLCEDVGEKGASLVPGHEARLAEAVGVV